MRKGLQSQLQIQMGFWLSTHCTAELAALHSSSVTVVKVRGPQLLAEKKTGFDRWGTLIYDPHQNQNIIMLRTAQIWIKVAGRKTDSQSATRYQIMHHTRITEYKKMNLTLRCKAIL
jgi:hypothetical protein